MSEAGGDVIGVDWRIELDKAWSQVPDKAVQGNLDPIALMADPDYMKDRAHEILRKAQGRTWSHLQSWTRDTAANLRR